MPWPASSPDCCWPSGPEGTRSWPAWVGRGLAAGNRERWSGPRLGRGSSLPVIAGALGGRVVLGVVLPAVVGPALDVGFVDVREATVFPFGGVVGLETSSGAITAERMTAPPEPGPQGVGLGLGEQAAFPSEPQRHAVGVVEVAADGAGEQRQQQCVEGDDGAVLELVERVGAELDLVEGFVEVEVVSSSVSRASKSTSRSWATRSVSPCMVTTNREGPTSPSKAAERWAINNIASDRRWAPSRASSPDRGRRPSRSVASATSAA